MPRYLVRWCAEVDAPTAHDAARRALKTKPPSETSVSRADTPGAWLRVDLAPEPLDATQSVREALWILTEHNALYFGEAHSTVVLARETLAAIETQLPALLRAYEDGAVEYGEGVGCGVWSALVAARKALFEFLGLPQEE